MTESPSMPSPGANDSAASGQTWSRLRDAAAGFPRGLLLILLCAVAALAALFWSNRAYHLRQAEIDGANLSWALESSLDATLRRVDADLAELSESFAAADFVAARAPDRQAGLRRHLARHLDKFREVRGIHVFDAEGRLLHSSRDTPPLEIADRAHFRRLKADPKAGLVFSEALTARVDGKPVLVAARGLRDAEGRFLGIVTMLIDLGHFSRLLDSVDLGPGGVIAIRRREDTRLVLRRPPLPALVNQPANYSIRDRILAGETAGVEYLPSPSDGIRRISSFRALRDYPFYVVIASAETDVLRGWRLETAIAGGIAAVLLAALALLGRRMSRSETNLRAFFDTIDDFLFVLDGNGNILQVNRVVLERLGHAEDYLRGRSVLEVHPEERRAEAGRIVGEMLSGRRDFCPVPLVAADGRRIPVETRVVRGRWQGQPALFGVSRDITDRVRIQRELEDEVSRRRLIFEQSGDGIALLRTDGSLAEFNPAFARMLGYPAAEMQGLRIWDWDVHWTRDELGPLLRQHGMQQIQVETRHRRKDGTRYDVEVTVNGVHWAGEDFLFCVHRDITARKLAEGQLRETAFLLAESQRIGQLGGWRADPVRNSVMWTEGVHAIVEMPLDYKPNLDTALDAYLPESR
ncbi:MAG: PAS domain S-box protein, partial [Rhodocyclaceae bacterium]|nr:PAS domain S-box protein [Rhodocyclaceae bacterium]